jgi:hypothetical protein
VSCTHVTLTQFQEANASIFPTEHSIRWYVRTHRRELLEAGALTEIAGRLLIAPQAFATTAAAIGRRKLERAL